MFSVGGNPQGEGQEYALDPLLKKKNYNMFFLLFSSFLAFFFLAEKIPYVVTHNVSPSSVEIYLERGCTITNRSIDLKFDINTGGRVIHV